MPRYTDVRVITYAPNTGAGGAQPNLEKNLATFTAALNAAKPIFDNNQAHFHPENPGDHLLKVFMAPEWTWRQTEMLYDEEDFHQIEAKLLDLSKKHPDILLFPGTILWWVPGQTEGATRPRAGSPPPAKKSVFSWETDKWYVMNTALVFFGGKLVHTCHKRFATTEPDEHIDIAKIEKETPDAFWKGWKGTPPDEVDEKGNPTSLPEAHVFAIPGIERGVPKNKTAKMTFGIEIGRDAVAGLLKKSGRLVDVQVLLSGSGGAGDGAALSNSSVAAVTNGLAIQCDGCGDWKKMGLHWLTVEKPLKLEAPSPEGKTFADSARTSFMKENASLVVRRHAPGKQRPNLEERLKDYLEFRESVGKSSDADLKKIFEDNVKVRQKWAEKHKERTNLIYQALKEESIKAWEDDALKGDGALEDASFFFRPSELGMELGFFIGVNWHIDAMFTALGALDDELFLLGNYICDKTPGLVWLQGPLKKLGATFEKTVFRDYEGNAAKNKDLVRGTIVAATGDPGKNKEAAANAAKELEKLIAPKYGFQLLGGSETTKDKSACGYSGWNYKILFHGHPKAAYKETDPMLALWGTTDGKPNEVPVGPIPAEIQLNTCEMMFSKHSLAKLVKMRVFESEAKYFEYEKKVGFQGGLGHCLYEINREFEGEKRTGAAAMLGQEYHDRARDVPFGKEAAKLAALADRLQNFSSTLTGKAKTIWDEHFDDEWKDKKTLSPGAHARKVEW